MSRRSGSSPSRSQTRRRGKCVPASVNCSAPIRAGSGSERSTRCRLGCCGDDVRHRLTFQNDFPGTKLGRLEQNYRSTQIILDAANGIIAENTARLGKTLFTEKKGGAPVTLLSSADERDEAEWLANEF